MALTTMFRCRLLFCLHAVASPSAQPRRFQSSRLGFAGARVALAMLTVFVAMPGTMPAQAPTTNVGTTSTTQTATMTITTAGTLHSIAVLTQGAARLDFQEVLPDGGTCTTGTDFDIGDTCTVQYTFAPTHPWVRYGGIALFDASGNLLGNFFLTGTGTGPQVSYPITSATATTALGSAFNSFDAVAVDGSGNVFVADTGNGAVKEIEAVGGIIPSNPTIRTLSSGFSSPAGIVVDGSGNVYVGDFGNSAVKEIEAVGGIIPPTPTIRTLGSGFISPAGIAVDGSGNVFVADFGNNAIKEIVAVNGVIPSSPTINTLGSGFRSPDAVAVDDSGNVFVADTDNSEVKEIEAVGGIIPPTPTIRRLGSGFNFPSGVAVDGAGNVYVGDSHNAAVKEIVAVNGVIPATNPTINTLGNGFTDPSGVAVDASGNVFVADSGTTAVSELNAQTAPTISFASTVVGDTSSDSPQTATLANNGNTPLVFAIPGAGSNPATTTGFSLSPSSTCPILNASSGATASLNAGLSCTEILSFTPVSPGNPITGTSTATDNNLNAASATQAFPLTGTATAGTLTVDVASPSVTVGATTVVLSADISFSSVTPGGAVTFSVNGAIAIAASCSVNSSSLICTANYNPSSLTVNSYPISVSVAADSNYNSASGSGTLTITKGTPSVVLRGPTSPFAVNTAETFTASVTPASSIVPTGAVSFTYTLNGTTKLIPGCTSVSLVSGAAACTTSALPVGSDTITSSIASDSNFNAAISNSIVETVTAGPLAEFSVPGAMVTIATSNPLTITAQDAGGNTVTTFNGTVNLTTSGATFSVLNPVQFSNGTATLNYTFNTVGPQTITATDTANSTVFGTGSFNVVPGPINSFNFSTPATATGGSSFSFRVTGKDAFGNVATNYSGTVHFTSSDPNAVLPADSTLTNGTRTFSATLATPGNQTITATDTVNTAASNHSSNILVSPPSLIVTTLNDDAGNAGLCTLQPAGNSTGTDTSCSLRDAVLHANAAGSASIEFDPKLTVSATEPSPATITLTNGQIEISSALQIAGPSNPLLLQVSGNNTSRIFQVDAGPTVQMQNFVVTDGGSGNGGAIVNLGVLHMNSMVVKSSHASAGGGIYQTVGTLTMTDVTVAGNTATGLGGGIDLQGGIASLKDCTISGNVSNGAAGGGIFTEAGSSINLVKTTISNNSGSTVAGGLNAGGGATISDSIIAGNSATGGSADESGTFTDGGGNIIGLSNAATSSINPMLAPLADYGGNTLTMVPLPGSPAICAGLVSADGGSATDQRGASHSTAYCTATQMDAGAVQTSYSLGFTPGPSDIIAGQNITPAPVVQITENGVAQSALTGPIAMTVQAGTLIGTTSVTSSGANDSATFSTLSLDTPENSDTLTAILTLNASGVSPAVVAMTTSGTFNVVAGTPTAANSSFVLPATAVAGTTITGTLTLKDQNGNLVLPTAVTFSTASSTTTFSTPTTVTTSSGVTSLQFSDTKTENVSIIVSVGGSQLLTGAVQITPAAAASVAVVSGNNQSAMVNTQFAAPLAVVVKDQFGNPVPNATVTASGPVTTNPSASFSSIAATGSNGQTSFTATADSLFGGPYNVTVGSSGASVATFALTNNAAQQTITFPQPTSPVTYSTGVTTTLTATASSNLGVTFQVISGPATLAGTVLSYTGIGGVVTVEADQIGNTTYAAATPVQRQITVNAVPAITFSIAGHTYGDAPFTVSATSNSSGAITYSLVSGNATVTKAGLVTLNGTGPVTIDASQTANGFFIAGTLNASFTVSAAGLTVSANNATRLYGAANPTFTGSVTGQKYSDNFSESFSTTAVVTSAAGQYSIVPAAAGTDLSDYTVTTTDGTLTIAQAPTTTSVSAGSTQINPGQSVTLTAQVLSTTSGTPTGMVTFFDNGAPLQTVTLAGGMASYTTTLSPGAAHTITVSYLGDPNFLPSTSSGTGVVTTVAPLSFTFTGTSANLTVAPGTNAVYTFSISPSFGSYVGPVTFTVSGLPPGATATFSPATIAANGGPQTVTMTVQTADAQARNELSGSPLGRTAIPAGLALLLMPLFGVRRLRRAARAKILMLLVLLGGLAGAAATLSGCGGGNGFSLQPPQTYTLTVTATSGSIVNSATVTLNVQ
jgi:large repetitive protein